LSFLLEEKRIFYKLWGQGNGGGGELYDRPCGRIKDAVRGAEIEAEK
jgi:hypothetical protein